jgi:mannose-6-phosphate isomerase-like protein (cupin superfamily)
LTQSFRVRLAGATLLGRGAAAAGVRRLALSGNVLGLVFQGQPVSALLGKHLDMTTPGRFAALKLLGHETNESIMLFEETVPVGTKSLFHLHRDSDEVAWVLAGEITFKIGDEVTVGGPGTCAFVPRNVPHAWKNTGRVLFLYTPAAAGRYVEELLKRPAGPISDDERNTLGERYRWEVAGPNPL